MAKDAFGIFKKCFGEQPVDYSHGGSCAGNLRKQVLVSLRFANKTRPIHLKVAQYVHGANFIENNTSAPSIRNQIQQLIEKLGTPITVIFKYLYEADWFGFVGTGSYELIRFTEKFDFAMVKPLL